jgi:hypothetical protein
MVSAVSYPYVTTSGTQSQQPSTATNNSPDNPDTTAKNSDSSASSASASGDSVTLSAQAQAVLSGQTTLDESFADVTANARAVIDAGYAKLKAAGTSFSYDTASTDQINTIYGSLDRRSLYAIASNSGGQFTDQEQTFANDCMTYQLETALGERTGADASPGVPSPGKVDYANDPAPGYLAGIKFLDSASPEEKASANWAQRRAILQTAYQETLQPKDGPPQNVDSGNPIVNLLAAALKGLKASQPGVGGTYVKDFDQLKNTPAFANIASELQQAIQQTASDQTKSAQTNRSIDISA